MPTSGDLKSGAERVFLGRDLAWGTTKDFFESLIVLMPEIIFVSD